MKKNSASIACRVATFLALSCVLAFTPGRAQEIDQEELPPPAVDSNRTATVAGVEVGQRQTRETAAPNVAPQGRISNRIQNRVQNRIRNRIDRNYDPTANATDPFDVATRETGSASNRITGRRDPSNPRTR